MVSDSDWVYVATALSDTNTTPESWLQLKDVPILTYSLDAVDGSGNIIPSYYYETGTSTLKEEFTSQVPTDSSHVYYNLNSDQQEDVRFLLNAPDDTTNSSLTDFDANDFAYRVSYADVANESFSQVSATSTNAGDITFIKGDVQGGEGAQAYIPRSSYYGADVDMSGDVWVSSTNSAVSSNLQPGGYGYFLLLHELGHAQGLEDASASYDDGRGYKQLFPSDLSYLDSQQYTIMSYKADTDINPTTDLGSEYVYPTGLQLLDILALQSMYGRNYGGIRSDGADENTIYSMGHGLGGTATTPFIYTIWDGAGTDIIDLTGYTSPAQIDLRQGHFSSIGVQGDGSTAVAPDSGGVDHGNLAIAFYTVIENAIGTGGADTIIGNEWSNVLYGAGGNDTIYGDGLIYDGTDSFHASDVNRPGPDAATDLSGDDVLIGGAGDDYFYGGKGNDIIHGGYNASDIASVNSGWDPAGEFTGTNNAAATALSNISYGSDGTDTADYSRLPEGSSASAGITVTYDNTGASNPISVEKGYGDEYGIDALFSVEKIVGSPWNDSFSGTTYSGQAYIYGSLGTDTVDLTSTTTTVDYSQYLISTTLIGSIEVITDGTDTTVYKAYSGEDTLTNVATIIGTSTIDSFDFESSPSVSMTYKGGAGSDNYYVGYEASGTLSIVESAGPGVDLIALDGRASIAVSSYSASSGHDTIDLAVTTSTFDEVVNLTFGTSTLSDGYGVETLELDGGLYVRGSDFYNWLSTTTDDLSSLTSSEIDLGVLAMLSDSYTGGTGGAGAGGGVLPTYDGSGNVTSMQIDPTVGGSPISYGIADVIDHPLVLTSFSESYSGGTYTSTAGWQTYEQAFNFIGGITPGDVRLTADGSQGAAALTINIDSLGFSLTISDFETGNTISGIEVYNSTLHGLIQDASGSTLVSTGVNTFGGSYLTLTGLSVDLSGSVTEHYFLEALNFAAGGSIDLTAPITFTGTDSGETLTGLDARADTIYGMGGDDSIYGYGGNDTIIGGAGDDQLYGGTGDDTYVFAAGWGNDTVHENTSEGTDTLHFTGIAPSDIRMYTDAYGYLHLVQISDPSNSVTVDAGLTGYNNAESTVGSYVESVTFDSSYSTTWDLTAGLNITGDNSGDNLYGTAYNDVITGGTGDDNIYGNAGNDTLIGGTGTDGLYGGPGDDTYVFSSGFGNATVHESLSEGSDTIHLAGINPADVRLWTDSYGYLHIEDTTNPSYNITVDAGLTGDNNAESTVGSYVEQITFDSSYSTTWDLTGGLNITGDNSGDILYGTAYNDVITGGTGDDTIYGNAGNDTIIGGTGSDYLAGGPGNDTYVFSSGFGNATIHESLSEGSDTIHLAGINPADVHLSTDSYGYLHIEDTTNPSYNITVDAGLTGDNNAESTVGSYVEQITFDSSYSTTWDLTAGLNITGDNSGDILYGTAYNDVITGGTGDDTIYGNAGNDTIIGGTGSDYLAGGPGNDTYVFSSGFGNATVHESLSEGSDTIHLAGINPADVHLSTDSYGYLHIEDTTNPSYNITVDAGLTGYNNAESTVGSYVEQITFDSSYSTTWDLTAGLNITGDNSGDSLYGTAFGDTVTGGTGADNIYGNAGDDVLYGAGGTDNLYGGPGADTFLFKAATAETGVATIMDFNTSDGDKIDLANVISTYDPMTMLIANFVQLATSGSDTQVKVDTDGTGTSYTQIATITGVTGLNLADLITDGNLIVHHT